MSSVTTIKLNTQFYSVFIDISYYENGRSVKSVYRTLRPIYGVHNRPTERTIRQTRE